MILFQGKDNVETLQLFFLGVTLKQSVARQLNASISVTLRIQSTKQKKKSIPDIIRYCVKYKKLDRLTNEFIQCISDFMYRFFSTGLSRYILEKFGPFNTKTYNLGINWRFQLVIKSFPLIPGLKSQNCVSPRFYVFWSTKLMVKNSKLLEVPRPRITRATCLLLQNARHF